jgi:hypothetical protein
MVDINRGLQVGVRSSVADFVVAMIRQYNDSHQIARQKTAEGF